MKTLSDEKQELSPRERFSLDIPLESNKYIYWRIFCWLVWTRNNRNTNQKIKEGEKE